MNDIKLISKRACEVFDTATVMTVDDNGKLFRVTLNNAGESLGVQQQARINGRVFFRTMSRRGAQKRRLLEFCKANRNVTW